MFYQRNRKDQIAWGNVNGQFSFDTAPPPLAPCPDGAERASSAIRWRAHCWATSRASTSPLRGLLGKFRYNQLEFYVQDTWKATTRLTLDYGMRFAGFRLNMTPRTRSRYSTRRHTTRRTR